MTTATYEVTGMTCEYCVRAVAAELKTLDGVSDVRRGQRRPARSPCSLPGTAPSAACSS